MSERLKSIETHSKQEALDLLLEESIFRQQYELMGVQPSTDTGDIDGFDVIFRPLSGRGVLAGSRLFGMKQCVGVRLIQPQQFTPEMINQAETEIRRSLAQYQIYDADYAILKTSDLIHWHNFYQQIDTERFVENLAHRAYELSGLTRATHRYKYKQLDAMRRLLNLDDQFQPKRGSHTDLYIHRIVPTAETRWKNQLDYAFVDEVDHLTPLPLNHIRLPYEEAGRVLVDGELLPEYVESNYMSVPGLIVLQPGENKREAYQRAIDARHQLQPQLAQAYPDIDPRTWVVPVISGGQLRLWKKLGYSQRLDAFNQVKGLTTEEILQFTFFGDHSLQRGELARLGLSLPYALSNQFDGSSNRFPIDLVFTESNNGHKQLSVVPEPLLGLDFSKFDHDQSCQDFDELPTKPLGTVAGMVVLPDSMTRAEMKDYMDNCDFFLRRHSGEQAAKTLIVTPKLFNEWVKRGSCLATQEEISLFSQQEPQRAVEYGLGAYADARYYYMRFQPGSVVGGTFDGFLAIHANDSLAEYHWINTGLNFQTPVDYHKVIQAKPSASQGLLPDLERGNLPMIPGIANIHWVAKTIQDNPSILYDAPDDNASRFLRASWYQAYRSGRMSDAWLRDQVGDETHERVLELAERDWPNWSPTEEVNHPVIYANHPHIDHVGMLAKMAETAEIVTHSEVYAGLASIDAKADGHDQRLLTITHITEPKARGNQYRTSPRRVHELASNQDYYSHGGIANRNELGAHSAPVIIQNFRVGGLTGPLVVNTGDLKIDETRLTQQAVEKLSGKADVIIMETTNGPRAEKPYLGKSEVDVTQSLDTIFNRHPDKLMVVATPPNHTRRLLGILEAAATNGRRVVVSQPHAINNINLQMTYNINMPDYVQSTFEAIPSFLTNYSLHDRPIDEQSKKTYVRALEFFARQYQQLHPGEELALVGQRELSENPDKWVLVISPFNEAEKMLYGVQLKPYLKGDGQVIDQGFVYVHSSYGPYDPLARMLITANYHWVTQNGGIYYADYEFPDVKKNKVKSVKRDDGLVFHVSGHADFDSMFEHVLMPLLGDDPRGKQLVLVHGTNPSIYKNEINRRMKQSRVLHEQQQVLVDTGREINRRLGLDKREQFKIHAGLRRYNHQQPLTNATPNGISGYYLALG